jgi:hypothetical protein
MIRKVLKILGIIVASLLIAIALLVAFFWLKVKYGTDITEYQAFEQTEAYIWNKVDLGDSCQCSDGSDYWIYTKKGNSDNLIIHFQGGGACWDDASCTSPLIFNPKTGFYFPKINEWFFKAFFSHGMLENDLDINPFKDWNIVFIPYCTGDLHIGNTENIYTDEDGNMTTVKHSGRINVMKALEWMRSNLTDFDKILISGESAGGFGNIFWSSHIVELFPGSRYYQLSDCSFLNSEVLVDAAKLWNAECENTFGFSAEADLINSALQYTSDKLESVDIKFFQSNSLFDEILVHFEAEVNKHDISNDDYIHKWSNDMLTAVGQNSDSIENYYYYITDWNQKKNGQTPHTFLSFTPFYNCIEENILFKDWLSDAIIKDQPYSVGTSFLK